MKTNLRTLIVLVCVASASRAQQVWKVNTNGEHGAHFLDLPAAVAAAAPGDTILVYNTPTSGVLFSGTTINKPLRIVGTRVGYPPTATANPWNVGIIGALSIVGIAAGQSVVLSNLWIRHWPPSSGLASPVNILDCAGSVLLDDVTYDGGGYYGQWISIERCADVVLRGCEFRIGGDPIRIVDSNLLLSNTWVVPEGPSTFGYAYTIQTESVRLLRSTMTVVGSLVSGPGPLNWQYPTARSAVALDASTLRVGASARVQGGLHPGAPGWYPGDYAAAFTFVSTAPSVVERDPRAYPFSHPYLQPPAIVPCDETYHDWVVAGYDFHVSTLGPAGGFALLLFGDTIPRVPTPIGVLGIDPLTAGVLDIVPLSVSQGLYQWTLHCPSAAPSAYAFGLQSLTLSPSGAIGLTQPSPLTVGWPTTRIP